MDRKACSSNNCPYILKSLTPAPKVSTLDILVACQETFKNKCPPLFKINCPVFELELLL